MIRLIEFHEGLSMSHDSGEEDLLTVVDEHRDEGRELPFGSSDITPLCLWDGTVSWRINVDENGFGDAAMTQWGEYEDDLIRIDAKTGQETYVAEGRTHLDGKDISLTSFYAMTKYEHTVVLFGVVYHQESTEKKIQEMLRKRDAA